MKTKLPSFVTALVATLIMALSLQLALAQTPDPAAFVTTDQPGYQPGGIVIITGDGFQAGETVILQVLRTDGTNCPSPQHEARTVVADETGAIQADWFLCPDDPPSTILQLTATGQTSARIAAAQFVNGAAIAAYVTTDQADYAPGSTVYITGGGFNAGENVSVQVVHADGSGTNDPVHQPWTVVADANGAFQTSWDVGNDHLGASLQVLAFRDPASVAAQANFTDSAATDIVLNPSSVLQNLPVGTSVGTFVATALYQSSQLLLVSGSGDTDNASFTIAGDILQTAAVFDYQTKSSYSIRVRFVNLYAYPTYFTYEKQFTIAVAEVNTGAPTDIRLSRSSVRDSQSAGTTVGILAAADPEISGAHSFALVSGEGDTDNASFAIFGTRLKTAVNLDNAGPDSYRIRVRATDQGGLTREKSLTLTRLRVAGPGMPFTKVITGTDPQGGEVTVTYSGIPPGATVTPPSGTSAASPVDVTLNWTPSLADIGTRRQTTMIFTDSQGVQTTHAFTIIVPSGHWFKYFEFVKTWTVKGQYQFWATYEGQPVPTVNPIVFTISQ